MLQNVKSLNEDIPFEDNSLDLSVEHYRKLFNQFNEGFCIIKMLFDDNNNPCDYIFLEVNSAFEKHSGLKNTLNKRIKEILPQIEDYWILTYGKVALTGESIHFKNYSPAFDKYFNVYAYRFGQAENFQVAVIFDDITEEEKAKTEYYKSEERFKRTLDSMIEGCAIIGFDFTYLYVNEANAKHAHLSQQEMIGKKMTDLLPGVEESIFYKGYQKCFQEQKVQHIEDKFTFADGSEAWYEVIASPIEDGIFIFSIDISERKESELYLKKILEELKEKEKKLVNAQRMSKIGNVELDLRTNKIYWSDEVFEIYERQITAGPPSYEEGINYIHPEDKNKIIDFVNSFNKNEQFEVDYRIVLPNNKIKYIAYYSVPVFENGVKIKRVGTIQDITDRKLMEIKLQEKIDEKEVLIRELYHRTKNNMQIVSSLLGLKQSTIKDENVRQVFEEMQSRVRSMALVHDNLYKSGSLSKLNIKKYILELVNLIFLSHSTNRNKIVFRHDIDDIIVLIDTALACGLIITELVINSIKHAFDEDEYGFIEIKLKQHDNKTIEFTISDNGKGLKEEDIDKEDSLGLQIFKSIAEEQLRAQVELMNDKGTIWKMTFKDSYYNERV